MSTFTLAADKLGNVSRAAYSSWNVGDAIQGTWSGGYPRVGAMLFSRLRDSVDWADQEITAIRLTLQFPEAGGNDEKTLYLYRGTQTELTGTGSAMLGASVGGVSTNGAAYNSTRTIYFSAESNAAAFANLVSWLQSGTSTTLAVYVNESATAYGWSENALYIRAATISIDHDVKGSKGTLDKDTVLAGESVTLTVDPMEADGTVTHKVQFKMGTAASSTYTLGSTTTSYTYTVPTSWLSQIPSAESGPAECILTTLVDGVQTAQRSIPFTVAAGAGVVPSFTLAASPLYTGTSKYYQGIGGAAIKITSAAAGTGAELASYKITGSEGFSAEGSLSSAGLTTNIVTLAQSGSHTYTVTVTDSRGRSTTKTVTFTVTAVAAPVINAFSVQRYTSRVGDSGATEYVASMDGDKVWVTADVSIDTAGGYNSATLLLRYAAEGGTETIVTVANVASTYSVTNSRTILTGTFALDTAYDFTLYLTDEAPNQVTASARVGESWAPLHIAGTGKGVAVGMYSSGTDSSPKFESEWPASFYGGIEGVTNYVSAETPTGGTWIDGKPVYRQVVSFGALAAGTEESYPFYAPGLQTVVSLRGMAALGNYPMPLPHVEENASRCVKCLLNIGSDWSWVIVGCGTGMSFDSGFVIVEYTKNE